MKQKQIIVGLGILVNVKNEVLITQRYDPGNEKTHMKWQVPGGKVEFGETVKEAVVREMKEEGLPEEFQATISTGWWTTCLEILPSKERRGGRY